MKLTIQPAKYVVAVSGGIDSVVLLDLLVSHGLQDLVVAHFDHGVRAEAYLDRQLVGRLAANYGLPFVFEEGKLGSRASEEVARRARYDFLERVRIQAGGQAIITAHHQDDVIETSIINLLRGTGRRGLSSLQSTSRVMRPLLKFPKSTLIDYARTHHLTWHEDATNTDQTYLRNYVRHKIVANFTPQQRGQWIKLLERVAHQNHQIDQALDKLLSRQPIAQLRRKWFINLPHNVSREIMAAWLRQAGIANYDQPMLERLTTYAKVLRPGKLIDARQSYVILVDNNCLSLETIVPNTGDRAPGRSPRPGLAK